MNRGTHIAIQFYRFLLACYPPTFRAEFGAEMQDVFRLRLEAGNPLPLFWMELWDWPGAVLQAHLRARRKKTKMTPLSRRELVAAMLIFILPLFTFVIAGVDLPEWSNYILLVVFWGSILFAIGLAITKRLPGWSLSYLGFILMLGVVVNPLWMASSEWVYPIFIKTFGARSLWPVSVSLFYSAIFEFLGSLTILFGALVLVNLLRLLPFTRTVWERIRVDWTQLSFLIYGGLVFFIVLVFEEYRYDDLWKFAAWAFLAAGAWSYLRARKEKQRIVSLLGGTTAAFWTVALAKWTLIPLQMWPSGYPIAPSEVTRWNETGGTLIIWLFYLGILCAPALLKRLPPPSGPVLGEDTDHARIQAA